MAIAGVIMAFVSVILLVSLVVGILVLVAQWRLYKKAGEHGWAALIPFYSQYVLVKITWGNGWLFLLYLVPLGNVIFAIATNIKLARAFGKSGGYAVGLIFLSFIFLPMLAFGSAQYQGADEKKSRGVIIATAVTGGAYILIMVILTVTGAVAGLSQYQGAGSVYVDDDDSYDDHDDADAVEEWEEEFYDQDGYGDYDGQEDFADDVPAEDYEPMEGYDDFVKVQLTNESSTVEVPLLRSEYLTVSDSTAVSMEDGIMTSLYLTYAYDDPASAVAQLVDMQKQSMADMPEYYENITTDELISGDGFALQQINYDSIGYDGTIYPCFDIIKCDVVEDDNVILLLTVDNSSATEDTEELLRDACEVYGIDFEFD